MSATKEPATRAGKPNVGEHVQHEPAIDVEPVTALQLRHLTDEVKALRELLLQEPSPAARAKKSSALELLVRFEGLLADMQELIVPMAPPPAHNRSFITIADNMATSIKALGPALAEIKTHVSPQLARSVAATENAWRKLSLACSQAWKFQNWLVPNHRTAATPPSSVPRAG